MHPMQFAALVVDCFREARDRKLFWVMTAISVMIAAGMACISFDEEGVSVLFGMWEIKAALLSTANPHLNALLGAILTQYIGDIYIGWIGIILALIATAGVFPTLLERGTIDVVLAKPMSRPMIFLGKYLGSMAFVAIQATIFVVLTLLVVGLRWGYWSWAYLWCIPLIVVLFSYIYAFSALFGVITRNAMAALLLSILAWIGIFIPQMAYETLESLPAMGVEVDQKWVRLCKGAKLLVPNTHDITYISGNLIGAAAASELAPMPDDTGEKSSFFLPDPQKLAEAERRVSDVNIVTSIGSSLLFEVVIIFIAIRLFKRRDF